MNHVLRGYDDGNCPFLMEDKVLASVILWQVICKAERRKTSREFEDDNEDTNKENCRQEQQKRFDHVSHQECSHLRFHHHIDRKRRRTRWQRLCEDAWSASAWQGLRSPRRRLLRIIGRGNLIVRLQILNSNLKLYKRWSSSGLEKFYGEILEWLVGRSGSKTSWIIDAWFPLLAIRTWSDPGSRLVSSARSR